MEKQNGYFSMFLIFDDINFFSSVGIFFALAMWFFAVRRDQQKTTL
jgi:hypothetical protein